MKPLGSQPPRIALGWWRFGRARLRAISCHEPGQTGGGQRLALNSAPAARLAWLCGRPSASARPSKVSPAEWATMNHGGTPDARSAPIIEPADVPTMTSALAGSQPVSVASACSPPVSQAPPMTPPAPSTRPTFMRSRPSSCPCQV